MTQKEFEQRVGKIVTPEDFDEINSVYMITHIDKDAFCAMYKTQPEIYRDILSLRDTLAHLTNKIDELNNKINYAFDVCLGKSVEHDDTQLSGLAVELCDGNKSEYLRRKISQGYDLTAADKQDLLKIL